MNAAVSSHGRLRIIISIVVAAWFCLAVIASIAGVFAAESSPPLALGAMAIVPIVIYGFLYARSRTFRQLVLAADPRLLTIANTWRLAGLVFVILYLRGILPAVFALPAGLGDIAIGATAPFIAWSIDDSRHFPPRGFVLWNALGMLDLFIAVSLGILSSPSPLGVLAGTATTEVMGKFPLSIVPTFLVPLFFIFHLIGLAQARQAAAHEAAS